VGRVEARSNAGLGGRRHRQPDVFAGNQQTHLEVEGRPQLAGVLDDDVPAAGAFQDGVLVVLGAVVEAAEQGVQA